MNRSSSSTENLSRRRFLTQLGGCLAGGLVTGLGGLPLAAQGRIGVGAARRPNVLFISIDDLNDWGGCLNGYPGKVHTPNIDRLAETGTLFTRAYCTSPICNPSRSALWTGKRPSTTGVYGQEQPWYLVEPRPVSLMALFQSNGYRVIGGGKVFHHAEWMKPDPAFDEYLPFRFTRWPLPNDCRQAGFARFGKHYVPDEQMPDYQVAQQSVDYLARPHDDPFLLIPGIFRPHTPLWTPRAYFDRYPLEEIVVPEPWPNDLDDVPEWGRRLADVANYYDPVVASGLVRELIQAYLASVTFVDEQVGRILAALESGPHKDNTIVVLWSDHGFHFGEKFHFAKHTLWEESLRIPFIMRVPGLTRPGVRCRRPLDTIDIYPTLAALCGIELKPQAVDGVSFGGLLADPHAPWDKPAASILMRGSISLRGERYRYTRYPDGTEELYDHEHDPEEHDNLAARPDSGRIKAGLARYLPVEYAPESPLHN